MHADEKHDVIARKYAHTCLDSRMPIFIYTEDNPQLTVLFFLMARFFDKYGEREKREIRFCLDPKVVYVDYCITSIERQVSVYS